MFHVKQSIIVFILYIIFVKTNFMGYLTFADYRKQIQGDNLMQVISADLTILQTAELQAIDEAFGFLGQKYDTALEFRSTENWGAAGIYAATDRVCLDAAAFTPTSAYAAGSLALYNGGIYSALAPVAAGPFTPVQWLYLGQQYAIFYGKKPAPGFDYRTPYSLGAQVYWKGSIYTAAKNTVDVFPDGPYSAEDWGIGVAYQIPAGTLPTNANCWIAGDNRSASVVMCVVDIALYHVHSRIAPRNIPDLRRDRYQNAIDMLRAYATGAMTATLPLKQPTQGTRIRFGGRPKSINYY